MKEMRSVTFHIDILSPTSSSTTPTYLFTFVTSGLLITLNILCLRFLAVRESRWHQASCSMGRTAIYVMYVCTYNLGNVGTYIYLHAYVVTTVLHSHQASFGR
ncbi:uncharacterized protein GGS25DRAFT_505705 [Hypoxylon fragiforme]|uniref:uncharacterized protein n=1 Tax=Hypoxylon fragiforme TaxID=63214 RepID=UPI0020C62248|nr:uncharacterized protein GGS25DRAFT_505705 [Hypoxylon fragiforme]KAI2603857.1 hypothetical protein GGS25DRAFT_505705 [Hypoxylon fragiforme]